MTKALILRGNIPDFLRRFVRIKMKETDSLTGATRTTTLWAAPDYLAVGTNADWARVQVTARIKLEPVPLYAYPDSTPTLIGRKTHSAAVCRACVVVC